jgi:hypothetical protein
MDLSKHIQHTIWCYGSYDLTEIISENTFEDAVDKLVEIKDGLKDFDYHLNMEAGTGHLYLSGDKYDKYDKRLDNEVTNV